MELAGAKSRWFVYHISNKSHVNLSATLRFLSTTWSDSIFMWVWVCSNQEAYSGTLAGQITLAPKVAVLEYPVRANWYELQLRWQMQQWISSAMCWERSYTGRLGPHSWRLHTSPTCYIIIHVISPQRMKLDFMDRMWHNIGGTYIVRPR